MSCAHVLTEDNTCTLCGKLVGVCRFCHQVEVLDDDGVIAYHDWPKPTRQVCRGAKLPPETTARTERILVLAKTIFAILDADRISAGAAYDPRLAIEALSHIVAGALGTSSVSLIDFVMAVQTSMAARVKTLAAIRGKAD